MRPRLGADKETGLASLGEADSTEIVGFTLMLDAENRAGDGKGLPSGTEPHPIISNKCEGRPEGRPSC